MLRAGYAAVALSVICAGCANETLPTPGALAVQPMNLMPSIAGTALPTASLSANLGGASTRRVPAPETIDLATDKTMAGRVLTAIALERVTGRKPDPAALMAYR